MKTIIEKAKEYQDEFDKKHHESWNLSRKGIAVIMAEFAEVYHNEQLIKEKQQRSKYHDIEEFYKDESEDQPKKIMMTSEEYYGKK